MNIDFGQRGVILRLGEVRSLRLLLNQGFDRFVGYNCQRHAHNLYPKYLQVRSNPYQPSSAGYRKSEKITLEGNARGLTGKHYAPQVIADEMLKPATAGSIIKSRENKDKPFFVYYPTVIPHLALQVPEEDLSQVPLGT